MITRRTMLKGSAASALLLSAPNIGGAADVKTLKLVPQANLSILDPTWSTAGVTTDHAYATFDMLYGLDGKKRTRPQMAEGHTVSDDGRTWTIKLRDGLWFHDGTPVLASDCVASIRRWSLRDTFGQLLKAATDSMDAPDDKTIRVRLKSPFPNLAYALAHPLASVCPMMPARIAGANDDEAITEMVGSGPYMFVADAFVSGSRVVYTKFDKYLPREEPADLTAGGKVAHFDRVEWHIIPDAGTAAAALQAGEVDWWEFPAPDLLPILRGNDDITVAQADPFGAVSVIRFNTLHPPFNNQAIRRAVLEAVDQDAYMQALVGNEPGAYRTCFAMFACGPESIREVGADIMGGPRDLEKARAAIQEAGYAGEKVVIVSPTDFPSIGPHGPVTADLLKKLGMNVELQETDWGTVLQRRLSKESVENGGWSIFHTWKPGINMSDPTGNQYIRGEGEKGYAGWFASERIEDLSKQWLNAKSPEEADAALDKMQEVAFEEVPFVPLGQWTLYTAYSSSLTGVIPFTFALPWNVRRV